MPTPLTRSAVALVAIVGSAALLSGCRVSQATAGPAAGTAVSTAPASSDTASSDTASSDTASSDTVTPAAAATSTQTPAAGGSVTGGSVTVAISSPVARSGTAAVDVSCAPGHVYRASAVSAVIDGDQISFDVTILGYRGPGSYAAVVSETFRASTGMVTSVAALPQVPAVITASGGSFSVHATGAQGRVLAGSLSWTCG